MSYIAAEQMYDAAKKENACQPALEWLASLPPHSNPLDYEHKNKAKWVYWYAHFVIKGRWSEAELMISASPEWAHFYARDIIKNRWPEAETVIAANSIYWHRYKKRFNLS